MAMKKKMLITGAAGFLGYHLVFLLNEYFEIAGTFHKKYASAVPTEFFKTDINDYRNFKNCIGRFKPDYIVHSAASADVDWCERNSTEAMKINADGTRNVAEACAKFDIRMIHISTDMVFDGKKGDYIETDTVNPINVYGKSKLTAEETVKFFSNGSVIFRVALLYGPSSPNKKGYIFSTMEKIRNGEKVKFFTDQIRTPLFTADVAQAINLCIKKDIPGGIYHLSGKDKITRYEFGMLMQKVYGFDKELIIPSVMRDIPTMAPRPKDVSLLHKKAENVFGFYPTPIEEALKSILI